MERRNIFLALVVYWASMVTVSTLEMHYIRTVNMNDTGELYTYDLKEVEKLDETSFKITADGELFVTVDNEWHVTVQVFRNAEGKEEFGESPYMSVQRKEICEFMQTTYKEKFYPFLEGCSNLPKPDECPINAGKFWIKDCVFNGEKYSSLMQKGMYRMDMFVSQDHGESHVTKMGISVFASVE